MDDLYLVVVIIEDGRIMVPLACHLHGSFLAQADPVSISFPVQHDLVAISPHTKKIRTELMIIPDHGQRE